MYVTMLDYQYDQMLACHGGVVSWQSRLSKHYGDNIPVVFAQIIRDLKKEIFFPEVTSYYDRNLKITDY